MSKFVLLAMRNLSQEIHSSVCLGSFLDLRGVKPAAEFVMLSDLEESAQAAVNLVVKN